MSMSEYLTKLSKENYKITKKYYDMNSGFIFNTAGKNVFIIGSSPVLKKQIKKLKLISEKNNPDNLFIVVDAAYKFCVDQGLKFTYTITTEGLPYLTYYDDYKTDDKILLAFCGSNTYTLNNFKGKIEFFEYKTDPHERCHIGNKFKGREFIVGGNVTSSVLGMCYYFGAKNVYLFGNELCYKNKIMTQVFDWHKKTEWWNKFQAMRTELFRKDGIEEHIKYRGQWTHSGFIHVCEWIEYCQKIFETRFNLFNCSGGILRIKEKSLREVYKNA